MPHVVIRGSLNLATFVSDFEPIQERGTGDRGGDISRADRIFLEHRGANALVECLVVESGRKQPFYIKISVHDSKSTVRVDPICRVERSEGVKELVAQLGARALRATPGGEIDVTNLVLPSTF